MRMAQESIDRWRQTQPTTGADDHKNFERGLEVAPYAEFLATVGAPRDPRNDDGQSASCAANLRIGRYRIISEIGRGSFGVVFRAVDTLLQRDVALKLPRPDRLLAGCGPPSFVHEARIGASLDHPGIVPVFETGQIGPIWYVASAYCVGPTLNDWLQRNSSIPLKLAAEVVALLADAVHHAHSRGILHRDLKPANVLLQSPSGETAQLLHPQVTDFGLACSIDEDPSIRNAALTGTLAYMAPEQTVDESFSVGTGSDIYALGVILFELLTNRLPFEAEDRDQLIRQIQEVPAPSTTATRIEVPRNLDAICLRCLAKAPCNRYGSAHELAADLRRYLAGECVEARPAGIVERIGRWGCRRPVAALLSGALLVTSLASVAVVTSLWRDAADSLQFAKQEQLARQRIDRQMQTSLLNLAWVTQEWYFQSAPGDSPFRDIARQVEHFYSAVASSGSDTRASTRLELAIKAASHSLAVRSAFQAGNDAAADREFAAGLAAWRLILDREPNNPQWPRAVALHVLTHAEGRRPKEDNLLYFFERPKLTSAAGSHLRDIKSAFVSLLYEIGEKHSALHNPDEVIRHLAAGITVGRELCNQPEASVETLTTTAAALHRLASVQRRIGQHELGLQTILEAQDLAEVAMTRATDQARPKQVAAGIHAYQATRSDGAAAATHFEAAERLYLELRTSEPTEVQHGVDLVELYTRAAQSAQRRDDTGLVLRRYTQALAVLTELLKQPLRHPELHLRLANVARRLGALYSASGDAQSARLHLEQATIAFVSAKIDKRHSKNQFLAWADCHQLLGELAIARDDATAAIQNHTMAITILESVRLRLPESLDIKRRMRRSEDALAALSSAHQAK